MNTRNNPALTKKAQYLRRNMTDEERHLWYDFLKLLPVTVNRQKVVGNYILDFYCAKAKLGIEIDGSQHYFNRGKHYDKIRDEKLKQMGITVVRYTNHDVKFHFNEVCEDILRRLGIN